jgi:hypothetical protein
MRRRFEHLVVELSLELDALVPRYRLWLALHEQGLDPDALTREDLLAFCAGPIDGFLRAHGLRLRDRARRRLLATLARFDPRHPTPYERVARI